MNKISVNFSKNIGKIKPMHAVNNGPIRARKGDQERGNFDAWVEAGIPYARNHDASFYATYGGEHTVDVWSIFPDKNADVNNPDSYDFTLTDGYTKTILDAGTEVFYRLGTKIEHWVKKYGSLPPPDFKKWAEICEHIVMHYNEGWADGFHYDIKYWEIWNEPDCANDAEVNSGNWNGTKEEFFDLFEITAKHLKGRFPNIKIGGPAIVGYPDWAKDFLTEMSKRKTPMDFFSWHTYCMEPAELLEKANWVKEYLINSGYSETESICDEYNYIKDWGNEFVYSIEQIISIKGAAFTAACMLAAQYSSIDMLMYYDARPTTFNGLFDFYTLRPLKGYYVFKMFNELYKLGDSCEVSVNEKNIYAVAAKNGEDSAVMVCYYTDDDNANNTEISIDINDLQKDYDLYLLDEDNDYKKIGKYKSGDKLNLKRNSVVLIKSY